jgi:hypothetical protein
MDLFDVRWAKGERRVAPETVPTICLQHPSSVGTALRFARRPPAFAGASLADPTPHRLTSRRNRAPAERASRLPPAASAAWSLTRTAIAVRDAVCMVCAAPLLPTSFGEWINPVVMRGPARMISKRRRFSAWGCVVVAPDPPLVVPPVGVRGLVFSAGRLVGGQHSCKHQ